MSLQDIITYEAPSMAEPLYKDVRLLITHGKGCKIYDDEGNEYYDLTGGSGVSNIGYSNPYFTEQISKQLDQVLCTGWKTPSVLRGELSKRLLSLMPESYGKILYTVTGSEAIEGALKIARAYTGRKKIIGFLGAYHGKTAGALEITSRAAFKKDVTNLDSNNIKLLYPSCSNCPLDEKKETCGIKCMDLNKFLLQNAAFDLSEVAAIIIEPIQGAEGMIVPSEEFIVELAAFCKEKNILLIFDEIFTGFGRTGKMFCFEHFGVVPDLLVVGKALGGGIPISLTVGSSEIMDALLPYKQTSTFSASALSLRAGITVLDIIEQEKIIENAAFQGEKIMRELLDLQHQYDWIHDVRGKGLMIGIELDPDQSARHNLVNEFIDTAKNMGMILIGGGVKNNVLKITPPLILSSEEVAEILQKINLIFKQLSLKING